MNNYLRYFLGCVLFLGGMTLPAPGQVQAPGLQAEDVFEMESVSDPRISPDGTRIVYVRRFADKMTDRRHSNLWIINTGGTNHRPLTTGNYSDSSPRWSPSGDRLLYVSNRGGKTQLHLRWMDTGQTSQLTNLENSPQQPAWSPDGEQIAFLSLVKAKPAKLISMPSPPRGAEWAKPAQVIDRLAYRFNGRGYLPHGYTHVFVLPAEGGTPRQVTSGDFHHGATTFGSQPPVWTPDGKHILFSANRREDWEYEPLDNEIYEVSVADGALRALTDRRGPDGSPAISPDGAKIAYTGFDDRYQGHQNTYLYVMNRDGTGSRAVSNELDRSAGSPQWAPDGSGVYFVYDDRGISKLALHALDGTLKIVAENVGSGASAYSGGVGYTLASNGNLAFTVTNARVPGDIAALTASGAEPKVLTSVNADLLSQRTLGEVEEIWYESSKDGRKIQGWIVKPPGFDPSKKYPLILEIHGGPFANYGPRFDLEKQIWAARGYVVFYANPRGSTSYGEEFANLIHHAYPGDDFYDLDSGVDAVIAQGYADPGNVFVGGGSGGGVLTAWMVGRSNRFRAAVSYYPVINWTSWVLTADIPSFGVKYWFPGFPWDHAEHYDSRSLLSVVGNVSTPTMVITGEADWRTPMSESEQYYTALKLRKVETVLVRVPNEPHGIRRRPSHHISKILHIAEWFDRHRK